MLSSTRKAFLFENSKDSYCVHRFQVALVMSDSLQPYGLQPTRLLYPWDSPGFSSPVGMVVGCHAFLWGIFPTQGLNPCLLCLLHWRKWVLYHQCHLGSPISLHSLYPKSVPCTAFQLYHSLVKVCLPHQGREFGLPMFSQLVQSLSRIRLFVTP